MLTLGPLGFAAPWLLTALAVLPVLWWLLRAMPPSPRLVPFPAIRLLFGLEQTEETPHRTPWWLLLLRLVLAALVIIGLAQPLLNPGAQLRGSGPLLLVIDDDWAAAKNWPARQAALNRLITQADRDGKPVMVLTTAPAANGEPIAPSKLVRAADARRLVQGLEPKPWPADRAAAGAALATAALSGSANVVWLANGLDDGQATALAEQLQPLGSLRIMTDPDDRLPTLLLPPEAEPTALIARGVRPVSGGAAVATVVATAEDGRQLAQETLRFAEGESTAVTRIALPSELRNRVARLQLAGESSVGATVLLDVRFRRRPVGIVSGDTLDLDQPLLGDLYYLDRALAPFAEVRRGALADLLTRQLAVLVLADIGTLTPDETAQLTRWLETGGVLVRFAGPRLAEGADTLLPVTLRRGGRAFGGVMTWGNPARLAAFDEAGPFAGLAIPDDVIVTKQVLAEPTPDLGSRTWARLSDGTPLVTAERRDNGWLILVHTTANAAWSNLALSGLYVDMLRRFVALSQGVAAADGSLPLPPLTTLDAFAVAGEPPALAAPIPAGGFAAARVTPRTPPGFYGSDIARRALNLTAALDTITGLPPPPAGVSRTTFGTDTQVDLKPWLLLAALALLLGDFVLALALRGVAARRRAAPDAPARWYHGDGDRNRRARCRCASRDRCARPEHRRAGAPQRRRRRRRGDRGDHLDTPGLCADRRPERRHGQCRRPDRAQRDPAPPHVGRTGRSGRRQRQDDGTGVLPAALLADNGRSADPVERRPPAPQQLHAPRRHDPVRYARSASRRHRRHRAGDTKAARAGRRSGRAAAGPSSARSRADEVVLSAAGFPRPLGRRQSVGAAARQPRQ